MNHLIFQFESQMILNMVLNQLSGHLKDYTYFCPEVKDQDFYLYDESFYFVFNFKAAKFPSNDA